MLGSPRTYPHGALAKRIYCRVVVVQSNSAQSEIKWRSALRSTRAHCSRTGASTLQHCSLLFPWNIPSMVSVPPRLQHVSSVQVPALQLP